jgi:hypothetical protein
MIRWQIIGAFEAGFSRAGIKPKMHRFGLD